MKCSGRTATAIIEFPADMILLIKRNTVPFKGYWALPGGRTEPGEAVEQTIVREVKEETGLDVAVVRKIGEYHEQGTQEGVEYDYHPACFLVKVVGGEMRKQQGEIQEIQLFSFEDVPENLAFVHNQMVEDFLATREAQAEKQFFSVS
jgi:8-oxo-dGTP diphosphatase